MKARNLKIHDELNRNVPVSVIIPCYNTVGTIERAVESVIMQTVLPLEIIIVDDKSTDGTGIIIQDIKRRYEHIVPIIILSNVENKGAGESRNNAWNIAGGEYIAFLDADDAWFKDKLEIQYKIMTENLNIIASCHRVSMTDLPSRSKTVSYRFINKYFALYKNPIMTPSVMIKSSITYRFKKDKRYAEDTLLWNSILWDDLKIAYIDMELGRVFKFFYGVSGLSGNMWAMEKGELYNYVDLIKEKENGYFFFVTALFFSIIKYLRRLMVIRFKRAMDNLFYGLMI